MKKFFTFLAMMAFTITAMAGINTSKTKSLKAAAPIVLDVVDPDVSDKEVYNIYENEDYKVYFDIVKNLPLDPARTYTLDDMDPDYTFIYSKNEVITNQYGTKSWKKYPITSASVKIGANNELEAVLEAKNDEDVISGTFVFDNSNPITVTLDGEIEYVADLNVYGVSARNIGSQVRADYVVSFGIKGESYESKNTFTIDDLVTNGNSITVATKETRITAANITLTVNTDSQTFEGTVIGADEKTYAINITTNIPSKEAKKEAVDFGAVLEVSEDEGDIKFVAQNDDARFVGYITVSPVTTDVPSGNYTLLSYTKYGKNSDFGYMLDEVENGKVTVTNNEGEISIVATFKQNNVEYTVTAKSAAPAPEQETVTITKGEGVYTVTSTSATAALLYLCKPMSWLDEGESPESALNDQLTGMASMVDSEETWEMYGHMGLEPAPKTFTIADYQEMYAGQEMFIIAANVGWDGKKLGVISNIAIETFNVPAAAPVVTIEKGEGILTVTSTSADAALLYLCKPMSWLDEGETPESALNDQLAGMASMVDSEETWEMYGHMGLEPAPKTFTIADYQEMYAGQEMFIIAANVGWDGEKLGVISNIAIENFTVSSTGINNIEAGAVKAVSKYLENGKIVILKNGKKYGVDAVEVK